MSGFVAGCHTTSGTPATEPSRTGEASYEAVPGANPTASSMVSKREFIPASPSRDNLPPIYPPNLLSLGLPPQRIVMRLSLDSSGHVAAVGASGGTDQVDATHRAEFERAIRAAVESWKFAPAVQRTFETSPDDGSGKPAYKILKSENAVATYFDIRFTFETREGQGVVTQSR